MFTADCDGGLDKGCEVKWREGSTDIGRHLLKNLDDESEGKTIYKSILIFKDLNHDINKNIVWLFERHKSSPRLNNIILLKVMAVTRGKHSEHCTEPACFIICTLLTDIPCTVLHGVPEHAAQMQYACDFNCGYSAEDFWSMWSPPQC